VTRVIDGDTIECRQRGIRVRLLGIDAPELSQGRFGAGARQALAGLTPVRAKVDLELDVETTDRYGRVLAYVWTRDSTFVNAEMLRSGYAVLYTKSPNVKHIETLTAAAQEARRARAGLWATSAFDCPPAAYRRHRCN